MPQKIINYTSPTTGKSRQFNWNKPTDPTDDDFAKLKEYVDYQDKPKEPEWYDKAIGFGLRTVPAVVGGFAGAPLGPLGVAGGGATGSAVGEGLAQAYELNRGLRDKGSAAEVGIQGAVGAIPFAGKVPGVGAGIGQIGKYALGHAVQGGALGAASNIASTKIETGEWPGLGQIGESALWGAGLAGATAAGLGKLNSRVKPTPKIVPDVEPPAAQYGGLITDEVHNNIINKALNPFKSDPLPPVDMLPKSVHDNFPSSATIRDPNIPEVENPFKVKKTVQPDSIGVKKEQIPDYEAVGYEVTDTYPDGSVLMQKGLKKLPKTIPFKPNSSHVSPFIGPFEDTNTAPKIPPTAGPVTQPNIPQNVPNTLPPVEPINTLPPNATNQQRQGYYKAVEDFRKPKLPPPTTLNIPDSVAFASKQELPPVEPIVNQPALANQRPELPIAPRQEIPTEPIIAPKRPELPPVEPLNWEQLPPNATNQQREDYYNRVENFRNPPKKVEREPIFHDLPPVKPIRPNVQEPEVLPRERTKFEETFGLEPGEELTPEQERNIKAHYEDQLRESYGEDTVGAEDALDELRGDIPTRSVEADRLSDEIKQAHSEGYVVYPKTNPDLPKLKRDGYKLIRKLSDGSLVLEHPGARKALPPVESIGEEPLIKRQPDVPEEIRDWINKNFDNNGEPLIKQQAAESKDKLYDIPDVIGDDPRPQGEIVAWKRRANVLHQELKEWTASNEKYGTKPSKAYLESQKQLQGIVEHIDRLEPPIKKQAANREEKAKILSDRFKKNLRQTSNPDEAHFLLPDGTMIAGNSRTHEGTAKSIGTSESTAKNAGIVRLAKGNANVSRPITLAQARQILDSHIMLTDPREGAINTPRYMDVESSKGGYDHKELNDKMTPNSLMEWVNNHFIKKQQDIPPNDPRYKEHVEYMKAAQHLYDNVSTMPVSGTKHRPIFHDPGNRLTPAERKWMENHPVIHELTRFYSNLIDDITTKMGRPDIADQIDGVGIIIDEGSHGIHITNPSNRKKGIIGFNPFIAIDRKNPADAARAIVTTSKHELAHVDTGVKPLQDFAFSISDQLDPRFKSFLADLQSQIDHANEVGGAESGHGLDFVFRLGEIYGQYGIKNRAKAVTRLEQILTKKSKGSGGYNPEISKLLHLYQESRWRKATTPDVLDRAGVKQTDTGAGKNSIPIDNQSNGKGTAINEKEARWKLMADQAAATNARRLARFGVIPEGSGTGGSGKGNAPPPPANPPSNPAGNSGTPKPNPIILGDKAKSAYSNAKEGLYKAVYEPIGTSVKTRLERLGPGGKDLAKELADERTESARYGGEHYLKTRQVMKDLNSSEQNEVVKLLSGKQDSSTNAKVTKAAATLDGSIEQLRKEAEKAKVQVKDDKGEWVDWKRGVNEKLPDYSKGLESLGSYQHEVARDIIRAERFGNLADKTSTIRHLINMTDDSNEARSLVDHLFNRTKPNISEGTLDAQNKWYKRATKMQVATKLSQFGITNLGDLASISSNLGVRNTAKAIMDTIGDWHGSTNIGVKSGAHAILQKEILHDVGVGKLTGKYYGANATEKFTRTVGALAGRAESQRLFELAKKNPKYAKQLGRFLDEDVSEVLKQKSLTPQQIDFAGGRGVELSSGVPDKLTLSKAFHADNPLLRLPLLFKRFAFVNSKNIVDSIKAEPDAVAKVAKAAKMLAMYGIAGEAVGDAKALVKSIGSGKSAGEELEDRNKKYDVGNPILNRLMANYLQSALLGIPGDISESVAAKKMGKFSGIAGGPVASDIDEALAGLGDATSGKFGKLGKSVARRIPYIGAGLADRFNKDEPSKSPLKGFKYSSLNR